MPALATTRAAPTLAQVGINAPPYLLLHVQLAGPPARRKVKVSAKAAKRPKAKTILWKSEKKELDIPTAILVFMRVIWFTHYTEN